LTHARLAFTESDWSSAQVRTIAIEEHFVAEALRDLMPPRSGFGSAEDLPGVGEARLSAMDEAGIDMQVLSPLAPLDPSKVSTTVARATNEELAALIAGHPTRFGGFATLPLGDPTAAADELEYAVTNLGLQGAMVNGTFNELFLDDAVFFPILERAAEIGAPIYLHPGRPPEAIRRIYYEGFDAATNLRFATSGFGWHIETAIHALRLMLCGVLERLPNLQLIIGHMGESLPFMIARAEQKLGYELTERFATRFHVTTSGFFTYPPLLTALQIVGADRILFAVDYPVSSNLEARAFLDGVSLSPADRAKICHENAELLLGLGTA
jgi:hypothetical protein